MAGAPWTMGPVLAPDSKVSSDGEARPGPALPMTRGRSIATDAARAGESPESVRRGTPPSPVSPSGAARTTAAKRKNARPMVRMASPTEATFWMIGIGMGMTSDSGPRCRRKEASSGGGRMMWMDEVMSAGVMPAAMRAGSQIGM